MDQRVGGGLLSWGIQWRKGEQEGRATGDEKTMKATYETCHITVMTSFNHDAAFSTHAAQGVHWDMATECAIGSSGLQ